MQRTLDGHGYWMLTRSGRVLVAIRENEQAANAYGVSTRPNLMVAFAISGFLAGLAGVLFVHHQNGVQLASYSAAESLVVFAMAVIGGLGSIPGALLGALYVRGANYFLPVEWQILATGAAVTLVAVTGTGFLAATGGSRFVVLSGRRGQEGRGGGPQRVEPRRTLAGQKCRRCHGVGVSAADEHARRRLAHRMHGGRCRWWSCEKSWHKHPRSRTLVRLPVRCSASQGGWRRTTSN